MEIKSQSKYNVYVDGSFINNTSVFSGWAFVVVSMRNEFVCAFNGLTKIPAVSRNIDGEVKAAYEASKWAKNNNVNIVIHYDYIGVENWITGAFKAKSLIAKTYIKQMNPYRDIVSFEKVKAHSNNKWNDMADMLAKRAITNPENTDIPDQKKNIELNEEIEVKKAKEKVFDKKKRKSKKERNKDEIVLRYKTGTSVKYFSYLMHDGDYYKIGKSRNPVRRLKDLRTGNIKCRLICYGKGVTEEYLHKLYASKKINLEWFDLDKDDISQIKHMLSNGIPKTGISLRNKYSKDRVNKFKSYIINFGQFKGKPIIKMNNRGQLSYCKWLRDEMVKSNDTDSFKYCVFDWWVTSGHISMNYSEID